MYFLSQRNDVYPSDSLLITIFVNVKIADCKFLFASAVVELKLNWGKLIGTKNNGTY